MISLLDIMPNSIPGWTAFDDIVEWCTMGANHHSSIRAHKEFPQGTIHTQE
jgi:hypothetical protein